MINRRWKTTPVFIWATIVFGIAVYTYFHPLTHSVYSYYAPATRNWWAGKNIYSTTTSWGGYRYSPLFAIFFTPFGLLPDRWGSALWKVFNCVFYAVGLWAWAERTPPITLTKARFDALVLLALPTSLISMYNGQANLIMLGSILLGLTAAQQNRWSAAAAWIAFATFIKPFALALALLLSALYLRQFATRFIIAIAVGLLLPFLTQSPDLVTVETTNWFTLLGETTGIRPEKYRSIDQLFRIYLHPLSPSAYLILELLMGGFILGLCLLHRKTRQEPRELLTQTFLFFSTWVILFGPATEAATYAMIAPAIAWTLVEALSRPDNKAKVLVLGISMFLMGPLATDLFGPTVRVFATEHGSMPMGGVIFFVYILLQTAKMQSQVKAGVAQVDS